MNHSLPAVVVIDIVAVAAVVTADKVVVDGKLLLIVVKRIVAVVAKGEVFMADMFKAASSVKMKNHLGAFERYRAGNSKPDEDLSFGDWWCSYLVKYYWCVWLSGT